MAGKCFPNPAVADNIKIICLQELSDVEIGLGIDEHCSKHCLFRLAVMRLGLNLSGLNFIN